MPKSENQKIIWRLAMARGRTRHQNGWVELTNAKTWKIHWEVYVKDPETGEESRKHKSRVVGSKSEMTKSDARDELNKIVGEINASKRSRNDSRVTFGWFYDNRFRPMREGSWGPATRDGNATDMDKYIRPVLGHIPLGELDLFRVQSAINDIAAGKFQRPTKEGQKPKRAPEGGYSFDLVRRCTTLTRSVIHLAVKLDFLQKDFSEDIRVPVCKATKKPTIDKVDILRLFRSVQKQPDSTIAVRDHLILQIGVFCALTSSELFGLKWDCFAGDYITIRNTAYHGDLYEWRVKRKSRFRQVPLAEPIKQEFERWKKLSTDTAPDDLVFPGRSGPMWPRVFLRKLQKLAKSLGITVPVTFQVMRRSCATRNQRNGSIKDVQAHLGHAKVETTGNVYMQEIPDSVRQMVAADVSDVLSTKVPKTRRIQ